MRLAATMCETVRRQLAIQVRQDRAIRPSLKTLLYERPAVLDQSPDVAKVNELLEGEILNGRPC
jgi:hypothetical protein